MRADIPRGQATRVEREDLVVKPLKTPLALAHDLRREAPVAIARRVDIDLALLGDQPLGAGAVAGVARAAGRLGVRLIAEVVGQLDLHRALHQPLGEIGQQAAGPSDLLLGRSARQQLVDHLVRDPLAIRSPGHLAQSRALHGVIDCLAAQPRASPRSRRGRRRLALRLAAGSLPIKTPRSHI